jgi:hypothetical protein
MAKRAFWTTDHQSAAPLTDQPTMSRLMSFIRRSADREPVVVFATFLGIAGIAAGAFVPPIRRALGADTRQYFGTPQSEAAKAAKAASSARVLGHGVLARTVREEAAAHPECATVWVKGAVGEQPSLVRSTDVDSEGNAYAIRRSSVVLKH